MKHCEECASQEGKFANICIFAACHCHLLAQPKDMYDCTDEPTEEERARKEHDDELKAETQQEQLHL